MQQSIHLIILWNIGPLTIVHYLAHISKLDILCIKW